MLRETLLPRLRSKSNKVLVPRALPEAVAKRGRGHPLSGRIREVDEVTVVDMDAVDVGSDIPDKRLGEDIDGAIRCDEKDIEAVKERSSGDAPVAGAFVAASILRVPLDVVVQ